MLVILTIYRTNWVVRDGICYKPHAGVIIEVKDDLPIIGNIQEIFVVDNSVITFKVEQFSTLYEDHYRAYVLQDDCINKTVPLSELFIHNPVHIHRSQTLGCFVILPHALCTL